MGDTPPVGSGQDHLPEAAAPANHGSTLAAWVMVTVVMVGALVSAVAVVAGHAWFFWVGLGVMVVGLAAGRALAMLGLGQPGPSGPRRGSVGSGSDIDPSSKEQ